MDVSIDADLAAPRVVVAVYHDGGLAGARVYLAGADLAVATSSSEGATTSSAPTRYPLRSPGGTAAFLLATFDLVPRGQASTLAAVGTHGRHWRARC